MGVRGREAATAAIQTPGPYRSCGTTILARHSLRSRRPPDRDRFDPFDESQAVLLGLFHRSPTRRITIHKKKANHTRREFLRQSAAGCFSAAASVSVIGLILPDSAEGLETSNYDWTKHRWVYLIDTTKCIGCGSCVRACRRENDVPEGLYRTWIERIAIPPEGEVHVDSPAGGEFGFDPDAPRSHVKKAFFVPKICNHCANTPCTQVCPVGASFTTKDGVVLVDDKHCIGCGYCVQACPYGSRYFNPATHTADKCTLCYHRLAKGMTTACVQACPVGARHLGDRKNPDDPVNEILATKRIQVLQPQLLTKPQCFYLGLDMEVR